jgi:hypothetical protein
MKVYLVVCLFLCQLPAAFAQEDTVTVKDPVRGTFELFVEDSAGLDPDREVLKIEYDFNSDGLPDLAISNSPNLCGNAGCDWDIFLRRSGGDYIYLDRLFFNDGAICIQPMAKGRSRIYTYTHYSAADGSIEEYELNSRDVKLVKPIAADTANWDRFLRLCKGNPSPMVVFSCNVQHFLRTQGCIWTRWRDY